MSVGDFLRIDTDVILIDGAIEVNQSMILAELIGCRVRDWIVEKIVIIISRILCSTCVNEG